MPSPKCPAALSARGASARARQAILHIDTAVRTPSPTGIEQRPSPSQHVMGGVQATYAGLPDFLTRVVEGELRRIPAAFARGRAHQRWTIVYLPQVCCVW